MHVRRAIPADASAIRALADDATAQIYDQVQASGAWLPALSLVALGPDGQIAGHVAGTRGSLGPAPALALAPPAVHPGLRGHGVGTALMHAILGAADALGEPLAAITGNPASYYTRFGFQPAAELGIDPPKPDWERYFLVRPLTGYTPALHGTFSYPRPFISG